MTYIEMGTYVGMLSIGWLVGFASSMAAVARDKGVVVLKEGQMVVSAKQFAEVSARVEKLESNPLKHNPRAKVRPPEDDFGDDDDEDDTA